MSIIDSFTKPHIWVDLANVYHCGGDMHPEHPRRIQEIVKRLQENKLPLEWHITENTIQKEFTNRLKWRHTEDGDCYITEFTNSIVERVQSMIKEAIHMIIHNKLKCAFVLARPPGHHADMKTGPRGFCHINNIWIAAEHLASMQYKNIYILDWDVHHGDGTEEIIRDNHHKYPNIKFISIHAYGPGIYPGTGASSSDDHVLNIALPRYTSADAYINVFNNQVLPYIKSPDILLVSAGYDAHTDDPMKYMCLQSNTYNTLSKSLKNLGCPVLFLLEGGYNPKALAESVEETLRAWTD